MNCTERSVLLLHSFSFNRIFSRLLTSSDCCPSCSILLWCSSHSPRGGTQCQTYPNPLVNSSPKGALTLEVGRGGITYPARKVYGTSRIRKESPNTIIGKQNDEIVNDVEFTKLAACPCSAGLHTAKLNYRSVGQGNKN
jgi:hypothetical protein